jgi:hypothetical protein
VVLLGDVDELEVQRERADDRGLLHRLEVANRLTERIARRTLSRLARQQANPLFGVEEIRPRLLDHDAAEYVPEESDVPPKPGVGAACAHAHILPRESV